MENEFVYVVYGKGKVKGRFQWVKIKEYDDLKAANRKAREMFYLLGWEEVTVERERKIKMAMIPELEEAEYQIFKERQRALIAESKISGIKKNLRDRVNLEL